MARAGGVTEEPWAFWDFLPTAVELAGASLPAGFRPDGFSLVEFLRGGSAPRREYFYWELHEGPSIQAVRFGDWKAVKRGPAQPIELYHLGRDLAERNDIAAEHPDQVARARALLEAAHEDIPEWPMVATRKERSEWRQQRGLHP